MSGGFGGKVTRRELLRKAGVAGTAAGLGGLAGFSPWSMARALATPSGRVDITHFIWIGGGQGIVPREVKRRNTMGRPRFAAAAMASSL